MRNTGRSFRCLLFSILLLGIMKSLMFAFIRKINKILRTVIIFNPIKMMNSFFGFKVTPYLFFHHKSMFKNIASAITKWMIRFEDKNITFCMFTLSTFPPRIILSKPHTFFSFRTALSIFFNSFIHFFSKSFIPNRNFVITFWRTIFSRTIFTLRQKTLFTYNTNTSFSKHTSSFLISITLLLALSSISCSTIAKRYDDGTLEIKGIGSAEWPDGTKITGEPMIKFPTLPRIDIEK